MFTQLNRIWQYLTEKRAKMVMNRYLSLFSKVSDRSTATLRNQPEARDRKIWITAHKYQASMFLASFQISQKIRGIWVKSRDPHNKLTPFVWSLDTFGRYGREPISIPNITIWILIKFCLTTAWHTYCYFLPEPSFTNRMPHVDSICNVDTLQFRG